MIQTINKPARVTRKMATAIDHILTNQFINVNFKTATFKTNIWDYFPVCIIISLTEKLVQNKHIYVYNRVIADKAAEPFNQALYETDWDEIESRTQKSKLEYKSYKNLFETKKMFKEASLFRNNY